MNTHPSQILVAYDFSDSAELALRHAFDLATEDPTRQFHFLVSLDPKKGLGLKKNETVDFAYSEEVQELATKRIKGLLEEAGYAGSLTMMVHVRIGEAGPQTLALAEEIGANLILVGSHGRTGVKRMLLGSVSEFIVRSAKCPVLVARTREYVDVARPTIIDVPEGAGGPEYVPPHRLQIKRPAPTRTNPWALY
tara:strand:+ start:52734 stop:53315 length:582 start_codon:yes stop_codon:yes gene_type:complete